jgi:hypothetical protein
MPHSFLIFDFGKDEEAAQQARHKVEGWKQGFRLGNKILIKFERDESASPPAENASPEKKGKSPKSHKETDAAPHSTVRLFVRLDFSDHEKLSHQRWLDRIPTEIPFRSAESEIVRPGDPSFAKTTDLFDTLS